MEITQASLPFTPWTDPALSRMPGMRPVEGNWIVVDDVYAGQMALRRQLLSTQPEVVVQTCPGSEAAQTALFDMVMDALPAGFSRAGGSVICPDGARVPMDAPPLHVLGAMLQEDLLILQRDEAEHVLTAGVLCFPASWTLSEKIGRPLTRIHTPVAPYDAQMAQRVQRLFDRVRPGRPMWRANVLGYADATLHQPRSETGPRPAPERARYLRSERQTVLRLSVPDTVLFAVHTWVVPLHRLTPDQRATCPVR
ncbi:DUF3445 domain-containing protein [Jannaschia sp. 2305UL9-9]|uniref:heme-dependent oxidative N-demethylase family protein n=1 Tax=Jannaschia sp. 2305UL9-9 TaxID=3121638 RepID=UPI0035276ADC